MILIYIVTGLGKVFFFQLFKLPTLKRGSTYRCSDANSGKLPKTAEPAHRCFLREQQGPVNYENKYSPGQKACRFWAFWAWHVLQKIGFGICFSTLSPAAIHQNVRRNVGMAQGVGLNLEIPHKRKHT